MLNYWWVTRPKRKLNSIPEVLASFADLSLNQEWEGQRNSHLAYEDALEEAGLKRKGERRDQTGRGGRTYKAYHKYTISNDHFNRMVHNYIGNISSYGDGDKPLAFFFYIAGGFGTNIDKQLKNIVDATGVNGSAVSVSNMIKLVEQHNQTPYSHKRIKEKFSVNRQVLLSDLA